MGKRKIGVFGSAVLGMQIGVAPNETVITVGELDKLGLNKEAVIDQFRHQTGVDLDLNQLIKVNSENEGSELRFETFDSISVVVPIEFARGPYNKDSLQQ